MAINRREMMVGIGLGLAAVVAGCHRPAGGARRRMEPGRASLLGEMAEPPDPYDVQVGQRLRKAREAANLTQEEVARFLSRNQGSVSAYEAGATRPTPVQIRDMCHLYRVSSDYILDVRQRDPAGTRKSDISA